MVRILLQCLPLMTHGLGNFFMTLCLAHLQQSINVTFAAHLVLSLLNVTWPQPFFSQPCASATFNSINVAFSDVSVTCLACVEAESAGRLLTVVN
ncbi:hypothetical protein JB92DRAFT_1862458 [Gautieria morchelliformis]|nr:hypothetical protein JB92DRAFT_1862458 [Gautieria morchelliformis]